MQLGRFAGKLLAVHSPRHQHIREQEIECHAALDGGERLGGVGGADDGVAEGLQLRHDGLAHQRMVLDDQDRLCPSFGQAGLGDLTQCVHMPFGPGQE